MDAAFDAAELHFVWPTGVLRAIGLRGEDIGVLATTYSRRGGAPTARLVPVYFDSVTNTSRTARQFLTVLADVDLTKLDIQVFAHASAYTLVTRFSPPLGTTIARRPVRFALPDLAPGTYTLLITGTSDYSVLTNETSVLIPPRNP